MSGIVSDIGQTMMVGRWMVAASETAGDAAGIVAAVAEWTLIADGLTTWLLVIPLLLIGLLLAALLLSALTAVLTVLTLIFVLPREFARHCGLLILRCFYRIHLYDRDHVPANCGAVLVANHVSWLDGVLMLVTAPRHIRMMVYAGNFRSRLMQRAGARWGAILVSPGPKSIVRALQIAEQAVKNGELVGIFPEGGITRSGLMQSFRPGVLRVVAGSDAAIVPLYFDGLWGSIFSFERQKFFWKIPRRWRRDIHVHFGEPVRSATEIKPVRQAVQHLGAKAVVMRLGKKTELPESVIRSCKKRLFAPKVADSAGTELTGGATLMRSLILRRLLRREVLATDEKHVGVLLPPSAGGVLTNLALAFDRRVAINLNYTVSSEVMNQCIQMAGIRHVLTSRKVMEKLELKIDAELVYLEDLRAKLTTADKLSSLAAAYLTPAGMLSRSLGLHHNQPDDVLTIIFTSGSTGIPKGVMLTHANVRHNVDAVDQVISLKPTDTIVGILPFFHSFGFTVTLWTVLALDIQGIYHFNPLDARQVGKLVQRHRGTILLTTPTFLRSYLRRCTPEEFASLDTIVAGAEKLPKDLCDAFEERFNLRPVEGYGTTELSPLVSVNVPPSRSHKSAKLDLREGTVGRPVPGVAAKIVDADGNDRGLNQPGMLLIKGANVMKGYLNQPEKTAEVIRDGWYTTGDIALIDDEGFIKITGRESRFSKIGGEMVPHLRVEELLLELVSGEHDEDGALKLAVTSVTDPKKGERLVVLHTPLTQTPDELVCALRGAGLPNIFIPSPDSFYQVPEIPVLGTGKLDLRALKDRAEELSAR
jgi:acyl-[acyl-carrier-protein]-phospholipid O-acyltransferase/long-chain-fatty-acid--[acyl-carrier-protein] ligase